MQHNLGPYQEGKGPALSLGLLNDASNCSAAARKKGGGRGADRGPVARFRDYTLKTLSSLYVSLSFQIAPQP